MSETLHWLARPRRSPARRSACQADLADRDAVADLARCAGQADILLNNKGLQHVSPVGSFPENR